MTVVPARPVRRARSSSPFCRAGRATPAPITGDLPMTRSASFRRTLLIGASLGSLVLAGALPLQSAYAQSAGPLFGSRGGTSPASTAADAAARAAQDAATQGAVASSATQRAIQSFQRAAATRSAMDAAQRTARAAAQAAQSTVPNGLTVGGLQVASGVATDPTLWQGAKAPSQTTTSDGRTAVTVDQTKQQAILNWDSFNVGQKTDLKFNQGGSDWAVLNRVTDAQTDPTKILGTITAPGTVLVMNRNGVIFGGASQVNVRNLVAGAASITDTQFLANGIYSPAQFGNLTPSFTHAGGSVKVEAGAQITTATPDTVTAGGGYVLLLGQTVENAGSITTPKGQTLLAAGDNFLVRSGLGTTSNLYSTTRGNEVASLIDDGSASGTVTNSGSIQAAQGDITLTGRTVTQNGVLFATTGVNQRGTIHLLNSASDTQGSVTIGANALTMIAPDLTSTDTALDSQRDALVKQSDTANINRASTASPQFNNLSTLNDRLDQSRVEIVSGGNVLFAGNSQTSAQGGQVAVQANAGRITVAKDALIDVSGVQGVALDMASNVIKVNVQGNELRDSPVNRDNDALKNNNVWLDIRDLVLVPAGTGGYASDRWYTRGGLLEVGGYLANQAHTIGEWAAIGGTITLAAKEVVASKGATFDLSGGSLDYQGGYITSTRVMDSDGRVYDISQAPALFKMAGYGDTFSRSHDRWGQQYTQTYADTMFGSRDYTRWEDGYTVGKDAGTLILSAPTVLFESDIAAGTINGQYQTNKRPAGTTDGYKTSQTTVANAGGLTVQNWLSTGTAILTKPVTADVAVSTVKPAVTGDSLPAGIWFDAAALNRAGLGSLWIAAKGALTLDAPLTLANGGNLALYGGTVTVNGNVTARGGSIALGQTTDESLLRSTSVSVADGVALDTRGLWTNLVTDPTSDVSRLAYVDGGAVTIRSYGDVTLGKGSSIDASAGGALSLTGKTTGGNGGDITLVASYSQSDTPNHGDLTLGGTLASSGFGRGGKLTLETGGAIAIGGAGITQGSQLTAGTASVYDLTLTTRLVVPAGTPLPLPLTTTISKLVNGDTAPPNTFPQSAAVVGPAGWTLPQGTYAYGAGYQTFYTPGAVIAPGTVLATVYGNLPTGYQIPQGSFDAKGLGISPLQVTYAPGRKLNSDATYAAGTIIPKGTVLASDAAVKPVLSTSIDPSLFQSGFGAYSINGQSGMTVADGVAITAQMPVLRLDDRAARTATGAAIAAVATSWTPPLYQEDPINGVLTQRVGASVTLASGVGADSGGKSTYQGFLTVGKGASISVDPAQSVRLASGGQVTVAGTITAPGGRIDIVNTLTGTNIDPGTLSVWIGDSAILDAAAHPYVATDRLGRSYGVVPNGGTINVGSVGGLLSQLGDNGLYQPGIEDSSYAYVVVRPGAQIYASGTSALLDVKDAGGTTAKVAVASDGGIIALRSNSGIHAEGTMIARAGGAGAAGGTLAVHLEAPSIVDNGILPAALTVGRLLTVSQAQTSTLSANLQPGQVDANLILGQGGIAADQIAAGGFDTVSLLGRTGILFNGDVRLNTARAVSLTSGLYANLSDGSVSINAPYVKFAGQDQFSGSYFRLADVLPTIGDSGKLSVTAGLLEVAGNGFSQFAETNLSSSGDLRFINGGGGMAPSLYAAHNVTLSGARIYPASSVTATVEAGYRLAPLGTNGGSSTPNIVLSDKTAILNIAQPGASADISAPYSAFGRLVLAAGTIRQGGALFAPFGSISLIASDRDLLNSGVNQTKSQVEFLPGSLTSVSGKGLILPYGGTGDGVTWSVDGAAPAALSLITGQYLKSDGTVDVNNVKTTGIVVQATNIVSDSGSTIDLSGGGTLAGAAFVSGRGGSVDTLLTALANANPANGYSSAQNPVYAILPGIVTAPVAGGYTSAWTGAVPAIGQQITLEKAVSGLPAGTYTLLPANYALLPGGYRIELGSRGVNAAIRLGAQVLPNGSVLTSGYQSVAGTSIRDSLPTQLIITAGAVVRTYSQYNETSYDAFQATRAATFNLLRPMLEADAKRLILLFNPLSRTAEGASDAALGWKGKADFTPATGGYAGATSIMAGATGSASYQDLIIAPDGNTSARSENQTIISASAINALMAPNIFIGGAPLLAQPSNDINQPQNVSIVLSDPFSHNNFSNSLILEKGATLTAGQVVLSVNSSGTIRLNDGASIDTRGFADLPLLDSSLGYAFGGGSPLLVASNGNASLYSGYAQFATGSISIGKGASIYTRGSIGFLTNAGVAFDGAPLLGAKSLDLTASAINLGSAANIAAAQAAGTLPVGFNLTQDLLTSLIAGDPAHGIPGVRFLRLGSANSVNIFGSAALDLSALDSLTLTTPAIYGAGKSGDAARLKLNDFIWNVSQRTASYNDYGSPNYASALPGATTLDGPGTGLGQLTIDSRSITLGHPAAIQGGSAVTFDHLMLGFSDVTLSASDRITTIGKTSLSLWQSGPSPSASFSPATYAGTGGNLTLSTPLLTTDPAGVAAIRNGGNLAIVLPSGASLFETGKATALGGRIDLISGGALTLDTAIALPSGRLTATASGDITLTGNSRLDLSGRSIALNDVTQYSWGGDVLLESTSGNIAQAPGSVIDVSASGNDAGTIALTATDAAAGRITLAGTLKGAGGKDRKGAGIDLRAQTIGTPASLSSDFAALNTALNAAGFTESRSFDLKQGDLVIGNELKAHSVAVSIDSGSLAVNGTIDASGATPGSISLAAQGDLILASGAVLDAHGSTAKLDGYGQAIEAPNRGHVELGSAAGTLRLNQGATIDLSTPAGTFGQIVLNAPRTGETSGDIAIDATGPLTIKGANSIALNAFWTYNLPDGSTISQSTLDGYDQASTSFINAAFGNTVLQTRLGGLSAYGAAFHLRPGVEIVSTGNLATSGDIDLSGYRYGPNANRDTTSAGYGAGEPMALVVRAGGNLTIGGGLSDGFKGAPGVPATPGTYDGVTSVDDPSSSFYLYNAGLAKPIYVSDAGKIYYLTQDWVVPNTPGYIKYKFCPTRCYSPGQTVPAGTMFLAYNVLFDTAAPLPGIATSFTPGMPAVPPSSGASIKGSMQALGTQSASLRLVAGADLAAASGRTLQAASKLGGSGDLLLENVEASATDANGIPIPSVVRTGTGSLDLLAGGSLKQNTLYGVYTAGTDTGAAGLPAATYMPDHGGDLTLVAQGDITGYSYSNPFTQVQFWAPTNWLVRSGNANTNASWSIRFGDSVTTNGITYLTGFTGFGTLGGGNVTLSAGGNAGTLPDAQANGPVYSALGIAVGASGKVLSVSKDGTTITGGTLAEAGGGNLSVKIGGALNSGNTFLNSGQAVDGSLSTFTNMRGGSSISAASIGLVSQIYGRSETSDPRGLNVAAPNLASPWGGIALLPGEGSLAVRTQGDLVIGTYGDVGQENATTSSKSFFALWRPDTTAVSLVSAGGNLVPVTGSGLGLGGNWFPIVTGTNLVIAPGNFSAIAPQGNIYLGLNVLAALELAPSLNRQLQLIAGGSIYGASLALGNVSLSSPSSTRIFLSGAGTGVNDIPNPFRPVVTDQTPYYNYSSFQDDSAANLSGSQNGVSRIYAINGDILNLALGEVATTYYGDGSLHTLYRAAQPARIIAGGDIVNLGAGSAGTSAGLILNNNATDVSVIKAGRNIYYANMQVAGPGSLEVTAGGTLYQGDNGSFTSIGPIVAGDTRLGASVAVTVGAGANGPDYAALTNLYLDPANLADLANGRALDDPANKGKVAKTYQNELIAWLNARFGYKAAGASDALTYFKTLAPEQQRIFLQQVYFAELKAGGREYNDADSPRYGSYLRGREMIATLFPASATYQGDLIMFGGSGIRTTFGGDIDVMTPGGQQVIGVQGVIPPASSGIVTQGSGDINLYSSGSILLGLSRIMTTFGGSILGWSANGDINAGRGAKTTVVYTPPKRVYDALGNVTLSPQVPSTGAGIATLAPIAEVPAGDVDLIAPLGTIDAGEAGIRVSGNVNLAALQVVNAANIQVKGNSAGIPQVPVVNVGALTAASSAASAVTQEATRVAERTRPHVRTDIPTIVTVTFAGFGEQP